MQHYDLILKFFKTREKCPICGFDLIRKLQVYAKHARRAVTYSSSPDTEDYKNLIFTKEDAGATSAPSTIDLINKMPPVIHFLSPQDVYLVCSKGGTPFSSEYHLWGQAPTFEPDLERFKFKNYDISISETEIKESVNQLNIPTKASHILAYTPDELFDKIRKLIMIQ